MASSASEEFGGSSRQGLLAHRLARCVLGIPNTVSLCKTMLEKQMLTVIASGKALYGSG